GPDIETPVTAAAVPPAAAPQVQPAPASPLPAPAPVPAPSAAPAPTSGPAPAPASPRTASVETVCREWGSFTEAEAKRARQWAQKNAAGVTVQLVTEAGPASWMVLVPPAP